MTLAQLTSISNLPKNIFTRIAGGGKKHFFHGDLHTERFFLMSLAGKINLEGARPGESEWGDIEDYPGGPTHKKVLSPKKLIACHVLDLSASLQVKIFSPEEQEMENISLQRPTRS